MLFMCLLDTQQNLCICNRLEAIFLIELYFLNLIPLIPYSAYKRYIPIKFDIYIYIDFFI